MSEPTQNEYITFKSDLAPSLQVGTYRISATQTLSKGSKINFFKKEVEDWIYVGGKRFRFDATDIDSVYPPANGNGQYTGVLPHIVFHKAGLPWEREVYSPFSESDPANTERRVPWLALLLFDQDDPAPTIQKMTIADLEKSSETKGLWFQKGFKREINETPDTTCEVIDIPKNIFLEIRPSIEDLELLAHAREVDTTQKADGILKPDSLKTFSVVVANRLPRIGKESIVHLVSFEKSQDILEGKIEGYNTIRLISLRTWRFSCEKTGGTFWDHFTALNDGGLESRDKENTLNPLLLHFPFPQSTRKLNNALALLRQGFVPMEHKFRQGLKSISWYRGPMIPLEVNKFISPPFASPDALLIYDPSIDYYDVSYAAAWQLGQLLALKNKNFAKHLYFWKQKTSIKERKDFERTKLKEVLPVEERKLENGKQGPMLIPKFSAIDGMVDSLDAQDEFNETQSDVTLQSSMVMRQENKNLRKDAIDNSGEEEEVIDHFLKSLRKLKPVPYNYLVADPKMLPSESLRFFFLDPNWITALVDGAFSVGDLITHDPNTKVLLSEEEQEKLSTEVPYSGFLLKSSIIQTWPGVEIWVRGKNEEGENQPLEFVRHERIAEDIILSIVFGEISELEFRKPAEGIHFGVQDPHEIKGKEKGELIEMTFEKGPRDPNNNSSEKLIKFKTNSSGRIDIADLAKQTNSSTSSSDFGYVMLQRSSAVNIQIKHQDNDD